MSRKKVLFVIYLCFLPISYVHGQQKEVMYTPIGTHSPKAYEYYLKGNRELMRFKIGLARDYFRKAVAIDSEFALPYVKLAWIYPWTGWVSQIEPAVKRAVKLASSLPEKEKKYIMAWKTSIEGRDKEAFKLLKEIPLSLRDREWYFTAVWLAPEHDTSIFYAQKIVDLEPNSPTGYVLLGIYYWDKYEDSLAILNLKKALKFDSNCGLAHYKLGCIYYKKGEFEKACDEIEQEIKANPQWGVPYNKLGYMYLSRAEYDKAVKFFKKYTEIEPDNPNAHDSYAEALFRKDDTRGAIKECQRAIKLDSTFSRPWYILGLIYEKLGRKEKAIKMYEKFIELGPMGKYYGSIEDAKKRLLKLKGERNK